MSENPYQAPAVVEVAAAESDVESTRLRYLNHEASVKSVGSLYLLGGICGVIGLITLFGVVAFGGKEIVVLALAGGIGVLKVIAGVGLQKFTRNGRILGAVIAGFSLLFFPIGTVIGGYILYLLLGAKGKVVFSPEYQAVIAQTPPYPVPDFAGGVDGSGTGVVDHRVWSGRIVPGATSGVVGGGMVG